MWRREVQLNLEILDMYLIILAHIRRQGQCSWRYFTHNQNKNLSYQTIPHKMQPIKEKENLLSNRILQITIYVFALRSILIRIYLSWSVNYLHSQKHMFPVNASSPRLKRQDKYS